MSFRALTDWADGDPPMPGMYLTRYSPGATRSSVPPQTMLYWDGVGWWTLDLLIQANSSPWQWRGLAFDPSKAAPITFGSSPATFEGCDCYLVGVPR